ncbi:MAG: Gfo/Idh/MocA family oxidoreductase [Candidatus Sumerlaeota bacterium]|nr:Gfo/Idh/MocA family oxidoreductase [Candidatus Sumerlaeota bacterium]
MKKRMSSDFRNASPTGRGTSRRRFLAGLASMAAAPYIIPASALGLEERPAPSERIHIGIIGMGGRGNDHLKTFLNRGETQVLAVCDPFQSKREASKMAAEKRYADLAGSGGYKGCAAYSDFRELLARPDIDAVTITSPENWHPLMAAYAARAGKDIYCEKALSLTIAEGRALVDTVRRYRRVFQTGTQQRSGRNFRFACELARNGYLGKLHTVKVAVPGGRALPNAVPKPAPPDLDYEMWLGPAPWTPYSDGKCSYNWYFIYDYCVGWIQSWGVHHIDIALWGAPSLMASTIEVDGTAVFPEDGLANTSITWRVNGVAADGVKLYFTDDSGQKHGCRFEGDKGWVHVDRGGIAAEPASLLKTALKPGEERLYESSDHHSNFIECIRTRRDPVSPVESGHAATTLTIVSDIATRLGRKVTWDWKSERFINDDTANRMLTRSMRSPWSML